MEQNVNWRPVMNTRWIVLGAFVAMAGCGGVETGSSTGTLSLEEVEGGVRGSFVDASEADLGRVDFSSRFVERGVLEVVLDFHGMSVTQLVDYEGGIMELDGFASENAEDTQMLVDDHELLLQLARALEPHTAESEQIAKLRDFASWYSEFPMGMEMQWLGQLREERGAYSICGYINTYTAGTHDGWFESNWSDKTTIDRCFISWDGACRGIANEDTQGTLFGSTSSMSCPSGEPDHSTSLEYARGDCLGQCGSGCGGSIYTWSCLDHDDCNRFGHSWAASAPGGHCADEFTNAGIEMVSEPSCG